MKYDVFGDWHRGWRVLCPNGDCIDNNGLGFNSESEAKTAAREHKKNSKDLSPEEFAAYCYKNGIVRKDDYKNKEEE